MNIAIYGIGGVGGYFGGKLAKAGFNTTFIARGAHLEAIRKNGLEVKSIYGDFKTSPTLATDDISTLKDADLILLGVKSWQVEDIARQIKPYLHKETVVLPLQNGADNADKLLSVLEDHQVLAGLCRIISFVESPGIIKHAAFHPQVLFGEMNNEKTDRVKEIKSVFDQADFDNRIADDIHLEIWRKFLFIATISGIGGLTRSVIGIMRESKGIRKIMEDTAQEIVQVANKKGIALSHQDVENTFKAIDKQTYDTTASMQRDIMEGKASELENFNGYIVKEGERLGVSTPINAFIYHCLLPMEEKAREKS
ncbi:2-dehydropantoate 2-reductase [Leptobacterium flavescens]|uniref:2-dehydropantoate 2-reductase n=1 Tax=Leptobacterium flavescens TaxID=472055 RepID=A0A6P0UN35_9FLAO|nr:2-dehydropantoate 2-reductase [Leptobacterium flavescens]NER14585.1 2-dehydropantoate 2-reductase [Leptobacterium flavescens]